MTLGEFYTFGAKQNCCSLWSTGQCPVPWLEHHANRRLSGFLSAHPLKITELFGETTEREIGLHLFLYKFWWLNCRTQINWTN
jgi:hypothetical protein